MEKLFIIRDNGYGKGSEMIEVMGVSRDEITTHESRQELPARVQGQLTYAACIEYLKSKGEGWAIVFPMWREVAPAMHRQYLRISATRAAVKIRVHEYDETSLLVVLEDTLFTKAPNINFMKPHDVLNFEYALKQQGKLEAADTPDSQDYRLYVELLMEQYEADPTYDGGILYVLNSASRQSQQARLHSEATRKKIRISTKKWDKNTLLLRFEDYL